MLAGVGTGTLLSSGEVLTFIACKVRRERLHTASATKRSVIESVLLGSERTVLMVLFYSG